MAEGALDIHFEITHVHVQVNRLSLLKYVMSEIQSPFKIRHPTIFKTSDIQELLPQLPFYELLLFDSLTLHFFAPQIPQQLQQPTIQYLPN